MSHDWECTAIGEKGYYFWRCKKCGTTRKYPSPQEAFIGECDERLRSTTKEPESGRGKSEPSGFQKQG